MSYRFESVGKVVAGQAHLIDMSFALAAGALNVLLGPTLAGKTSVLRLLAGLDRPSSGRIWAAQTARERDVTAQTARERDVAMVYQQFINYPAFTVRENIAAPLRRRRLGRKAVAERVAEAAAQLRIGHLLDRLPAELSGGQQQRLAIARALVKDARLLLLDEPLVNLDYKLREELRAELRQIFERRQATVVYATTEPHEALLMGGHVVVLDQGRVLQSGRTIEVYRRPASVRVGQVFSDPPINLIDGRVADGRAVLAGDIALPLTRHLAGLAAGTYRFGVRASHLAVERARPEDVEFAGVVELAEVSGSETFVHIRHGDTAMVVQEDGVHSLQLGQPIAVFLAAHHLFAFDNAGRLVAAP